MHNKVPEKKRDKAVAFSARLNAALDAAGVPQKGRGRQVDVAQMLGLSQGGARKLLEGRSLPEFETLELIAEKLGIRLEWLIAGTGDMKHPDVADVPHATTNEAVLELAVSKIVQEAKEKGQTLSAEQIARLSVGLYKQIISVIERGNHGPKDRQAGGSSGKGDSK